MQEDDYGPYDVLVVGDLIASEQSRSQVLGNKDIYRRRFRYFHVSVRNQLGHSVDLELFK
jgi:hypothetical protein